MAYLTTNNISNIIATNKSKSPLRITIKYINCKYYTNIDCNINACSKMR